GGSELGVGEGDQTGAAKVRHTMGDVTSVGRFVTLKWRRRGPPCCMAWRSADGGSGSLPKLRQEAARGCAWRVVPGLLGAGQPGRRRPGGTGPGLARC